MERAKPDGPRCAAGTGRRAAHAVRGCPACRRRIRDTVRAWCDARRSQPSAAAAARCDCSRDLERCSIVAAGPSLPNRGHAGDRRARAADVDGPPRRHAARRERHQIPPRRGSRPAPMRCAASPPSCRGSDALQPVFEEVLDNSDAPVPRGPRRPVAVAPEPRASARARRRAATSPTRSSERVARATADSNLAGFEALRRETSSSSRTRPTRGSRRRCARSTPTSGIASLCFVPAVFRGAPLALLVALPRRAVRLVAGRDGAGPELRRHDRDGHRQRPAHGLRGGSRRAAPGDPGPVRPAVAASRTSAASARRSSPRRARSSPYDTVRVYRVDHDTGWCEPIAFQGVFMGRSDPEPELLRVRIGEGLTGWVAEHGEPLLLGDAHDDPRSLIVGDTTGPESMLVVPMTYEGHVRGIVVASRAGPGPVRAGRRDDAEHLRRRRRAGAGQRRAAGAAPHAAGRAGAPARQPAPAHGRQRAAAVDARPDGRPRDDRRLAEDRWSPTTR